MIGVIVASRKVGINPDNVATPIAASLGDLITLSLLAGISTGLYKELGKHTHSLQIKCDTWSRVEFIQWCTVFTQLRYFSFLTV